MTVLEISGLRKEYKATTAVDGVSFVVRPKEIVGLLGPNGAGKTTTINMVLGILQPTAGSIRIQGTDVARKRSEALAHTNFAAVYAQLPGNMTVAQNLRIFGLLYGVPRLAERITQVMQTFDLQALKDVRCGILSSGEQTRVSLAKAMLNQPALLLLDEPTASLDPSAARTVREKIKEYRASGKGGILWTSHNMHEVAAVCDRVLFMSHGKILLEGDPQTLPGQYGKDNLEELFVSVAREPLALEAV
jgi:ABC-2 type transport system ATP-binding protein